LVDGAIGKLIPEVAVQRLMIDPAQIQGAEIILTEEQRHYLQRVMRLQDGSEFQAIDGSGALYLAKVLLSNAQIVRQLPGVNLELPLAVTLVLAIPKSGIDEVVRACTELGVHEIYPVTSDRTISQPSHQKWQRWIKIAQEATEQCERLRSPQIHEVQPWSKVLSVLVGQRFICTARGNSPHLLSCVNNGNLPLSMAIGPEGGWTNRELSIATDCGWQPVSLGQRVLRSITAPIAVMSMISGFTESGVPVKNLS
jgi:16S rRNA (uracil1498-N3)-methyltransferase